MSQQDNDIVLIAAMGPTGSGKSAFINLASGSKLHVGETLLSCTDRVNATAPFQFKGRRVVLVDTPGFDDTDKSDTDILLMISEYLAQSYQQGMKFAGILYFHRISDFRVGGVSRRNFEIFRQLCGEATLKNVIFVTNMWGEVTLEKGDEREAELKADKRFFGAAIDKGAQVVRHHNTKESTEVILGGIVDNAPLPLQIQEEIVDKKLSFDATTAGGALQQHLKDLEAKYKKEIDEMREQIKGMAADAVAREELIEETRERAKDVKRVHKGMAKLKKDLHKKLEAGRREALDELRRQKEMAELLRQIEELRRQKDMAELLRRREAAENQRLWTERMEAKEKLIQAEREANAKLVQQMLQEHEESIKFERERADKAKAEEMRQADVAAEATRKLNANMNQHFPGRNYF